MDAKENLVLKPSQLSSPTSVSLICRQHIYSTHTPCLELGIQAVVSQRPGELLLTLQYPAVPSARKGSKHSTAPQVSRVGRKASQRRINLSYMCVVPPGGKQVEGPQATGPARKEERAHLIRQHPSNANTQSPQAYGHTTNRLPPGPHTGPSRGLVQSTVRPSPASRAPRA